MSTEMAKADLKRLRKCLGKTDAAEWETVALTMEPAEMLEGADAVAAAMQELCAADGDAWVCLTDRVLYREQGRWQPAFDDENPDPTAGHVLSAEFAPSDGVGISLRHIRGDLWRKVTLREGEGGGPVLVRRWSLWSVIEPLSLVYRVYWQLGNDEFPRYRPVAQRFCGFEPTPGTKD